MKINATLITRKFIQFIIFSAFLNLTSISFAVMPLNNQPQGEEWIKRGEEIPPGAKLGIYRDLPLNLSVFKKDNVIDDIDTFLNESLQDLTNLPYSDFQLHYSIEIPANRVHNGIIYVEYRQNKDGMEIPYSSLRFMVKSTPHGPLLVHSRSKLFPDIVFKDQNQTLLNSVALQNRAKEVLGLDQTQTTLIRTNQVVRYIKGQWRKIYEANFDKSDYTAVVDMHTGTSWKRDDRHYISFFGDSLSGVVEGRGVLFDPVNTPELDLLSLEDLRLWLSTGEITYSGEDGSYNFGPLVPEERTLFASLEGHWTKVISCSQDPTCELPDPDLLMEITIPSGQTIANILFNPIGDLEFDTARVNAYYHTTYIHNWVKERVPDWTDIDQMLLTFVNVQGACNAFYNMDSSRIIFLSAGTAGEPPILYECINMAFDTVIYHEYGHFLDDMAGGISEISYGYIAEAWSDLFAVYVSEQPDIGENAFNPIIPGPGGLPRHAENDYQFEQMMGSYQYAEMWAGFGWHLRENLADQYNTEGIGIAEDLMVSLLLVNSENILWAVYDMLLIDDDDEDLENGTPHLSAIDPALDHHGIPRLDQMFPFVVPISHSTIQSAIDSAVDGDEVYVLKEVDDVFPPPDYDEVIDFQGKAITVRGISKPEIKGALFVSGEGRDSILKNFKLHNTHSSEKTIRIDQSSPSIINSSMQGVDISSPGGVLSIVNGSSPLIVNSIISGGAIFGGGVGCQNSSAEFVNTTFSYNVASEAGQAIYADNCNLNITNSIIWSPSNNGEMITLINNSEAVITYSDIQGGWPGEGNIDNDPLFIVHSNIQSGSPAIDAGNGDVAFEFDYLNNSRVDDPTVVNSGIGIPNYTDMGAYEFQPEFTICVGDINGDGIVGPFDLAVVLSNWGGSGPEGDLNGDGDVGPMDLALVLGNWGVCGATSQEAPGDDDWNTLVTFFGEGRIPKILRGFFGNFNEIQVK